MEFSYRGASSRPPPSCSGARGAIACDHFEYRPLDLYIPLLLLLLFVGAQEWIRRRAPAPLVAAYLGLVFGGLVLIPWESHHQYPLRYITGFPGLAVAREADAAR